MPLTPALTRFNIAALRIGLGLLSGQIAFGQTNAPTTRTDVLVVGAGISGLSAALEAARIGAQVTVIDMASVFGGHAVMAEGGLLFAGSPLQLKNGIHDTPERAYNDMLAWGEDINHGWAKYYLENGLKEVHDWLTEMGVTFESVRQLAGNSVARFHYTKGRGLGLVSPLYAACVAMPNIQFVWNVRVAKLRAENGRHFAEATNLRTSETITFAAAALVLATGGSQNNFELLKQNWPKDLPFPQKILLGSGVNSVGDGLKLAAQVGGKIAHMDYQWHYPWGLPDPRDPSGKRGLNARNTLSVWVNAEGRRFTNEVAGAKFNMPTLIAQPGGTYWMIFDEGTKRHFEIAGSGWAEMETLDRMILSNPALTTKQDTIKELAEAIKLPADTLAQTIARFNELVARGDDVDFARFGPSSAKWVGKASVPRMQPQVLNNPPFYALQIFPLSRKNNGGVQIDLSCRVLDESGNPIEGLFAVGELTGSGGMNGKAGLEGVWLAPGVALGRVAGRTAAADARQRPSKSFSVAAPVAKIVAEQKSCRECHNLEALVTQNRTGYWHFEKVHQRVLETQKTCVECHAEMTPNNAAPHRINRTLQIAACTQCHGQ